MTVPVPVNPLISHIAVWPVACCQIRSVLLSPLKSPVCVTAQLESLRTIAEEVETAPFINQIAVCPVALLRHTRSALRSPLKSPVCVTTQFKFREQRGATEGSEAVHQPYNGLPGGAVAPADRYCRRRRSRRLA